MAQVLLQLTGVDFLGRLESLGYHYDNAISSYIAYYADIQPEFAESDVVETLHGLFLRLALRDKRHRLPMLLGYLTDYVPDVYAKLLPLAATASTLDDHDKLDDLIKRVIIPDFIDEAPAINRLLLAPEALAPIRSDLGGMQEFIDSVRYSVATDNWFGALFMALALPDICGAVEHGEATGARYKDWFNRYLKPVYDPDDIGLMSVAHAEAVKFTAEECYQFRCKALHQGLQYRGKRLSPDARIEFSPTSGVTIHRAAIGDTWVLSIGLFCEDVCQAVEAWLFDVRNDSTIQSRLAELMTI